ncbi:MAG: MamK family actin-like protein [Nitrospirota bacterium]|nr:MamK family actin-like protein [Nitrospirota bacterium]
MTKPKLLNVGIDLGTSRSVIACDNGMRMFLPSYVGFPKDSVSQKMLGKKVVFGEETLRHRMSLDFFRPIEAGVLKHSDDPDKDPGGYGKTVEVARTLLAHLVEQVTAEEEGDVVLRGVIGAPALASRKNKKALLDISKGIFETVMIASEPFCVAYGLGHLSNALVIDIGAGTVDLCRMHGTVPDEADQITTFKAGDTIDQVFYELITKKYPEAGLTVNMVKRFKEENATVSDHGDAIFIELPVNGKPEMLDVTEELRGACREIVPHIVAGIKKLVATYDPEFQNELKNKVILAGGGSQIIGLAKEIEDFMHTALGSGRVTRIEEPLYAGANGALMLAKDMPDEYWYELSEA